MTGSPISSLGGASLPASTVGLALSARERVVDLLQLRFADDHLSLDEFERRVAVAYQAKTATELEALVPDLAPEVAVAHVPERARILTVLSNHERNGPMTVPRHLEIVTVMGNVELDMSDATFAPGDTEIEISAVMGNVEITVPFGVRIESSGDGFFGNFDYKTAEIVSYPSDAARVVRITGHAVFSSVEIGAAPSRTLRQLHDAPRRLR
ncbi:MAG TPA: DUF1707 domain-containing protein [Gemmatimonadaceae bacterium]